LFSISSECAPFDFIYSPKIKNYISSFTFRDKQYNGGKLIIAL